MKQPRIKGQALALVLIVVVVAVIVAFSITNRVVQDIRQQGEERASTRAETISESAVENITSQLQSGQLKPDNTGTGTKTATFAISNVSPEGQSLTTLGLCDPTSTDVEKQCDKNSVVQVGYYKMIIQFKLFDSENMEVFMNEPTSTPPYPAPVTPANSEMIVHLKTTGNDSFELLGSKLLVKGFVRDARPPEGLKVIGECIINIDGTSPGCLPASMQISKMADCEVVRVKANLADATIGKDTLLGDTCFKVKTVGTGVSSYRIKPILKKKGVNVPYVDVSVTASAAVNADKELPVFQMAMITAGVYSGIAANDQQVFQQTTRLVLLNKSVPEIADYVLYNGSNETIKKCRLGNDPNAICN